MRKDDSYCINPSLIIDRNLFSPRDEKFISGRKMFLSIIFWNDKRKKPLV